MAEEMQRPREVEADERLLEALRGVVQRMDATPAAVEAAALGAFAWRTIDADLAELVYDSLLDDDRLVGVRAVDASRTLTFEGPTFSVEIEVAEESGSRRLLGQLVPPASARIEVRHSGGILQLGADEVGRFSAEGVAAGPVSLRCRVEGVDGPPLDTAWVTV